MDRRQGIEGLTAAANSPSAPPSAQGKSGARRRQSIASLTFILALALILVSKPGKQRADVGQPPLRDDRSAEPGFEVRRPGWIAEGCFRAGDVGPVSLHAGESREVGLGPYVGGHAGTRAIRTAHEIGIKRSRGLADLIDRAGDRSGFSSTGSEPVQILDLRDRLPLRLVPARPAVFLFIGIEVGNRAVGRRPGSLDRVARQPLEVNRLVPR